ncbi:hypothetical protein ACH42_06630 [Endozoicomonas sp. (ex Bugula neritina AB1)]|nr:hypothetical protein ACH42_06630 [Endozoicomonas sp. (ex Bugula neritina AB1)]
MPAQRQSLGDSDQDIRQGITPLVDPTQITTNSLPPPDERPTNSSLSDNSEAVESSLTQGACTDNRSPITRDQLLALIDNTLPNSTSTFTFRGRVRGCSDSYLPQALPRYVEIYLKRVSKDKSYSEAEATAEVLRRYKFITLCDDITSLFQNCCQQFGGAISEQEGYEDNLRLLTDVSLQLDNESINPNYGRFTETFSSSHQPSTESELIGFIMKALNSGREICLGLQLQEHCLIGQCTPVMPYNYSQSLEGIRILLPGNQRSAQFNRDFNAVLANILQGLLQRYPNITVAAISYLRNSKE